MSLRLYILFIFTSVFAGFTSCSAIVNPMGIIQVFDDNLLIINDSTIYDFGQIPVGETSPEITFFVRNIGRETFNLNGDPDIVELNDANDCFIIDQSQTIRELQSGETTSFTLSFHPQELGKKSATLTIKNNCPESSNFNFELNGEGILSEINIRQENTNIECGSGKYNFGSVAHGDSSGLVEFTIENIGIVDLNLTGTNNYIEISGTDADNFEVVQTNIVTPIAGGDTTIFTIEFKPTADGEKTANISIANDDADENPYTFEIVGTGVSSDISVIDENGYDIVNGIDRFDFGFININSSITFDFTIQNLGTIDLELIGNPKIEISGASVFTVISSPTTPIAPSHDSTFTIEFAPTNDQQYKATVSIESNDPDENPYTFEIYGKGKSDEVYFDFNGDGYEDILIGAPDEHIGQISGAAYIFLGGSSFPSTKDTNDAEVKFIGQSYLKGFADKVATIGDYNGDGFDDILIGDRYYTSGTGIAYIFFGSSNPPALTNAQNADVTLNGEMIYSIFAISLAGIGDFNKDGFSDIIISAPHDRINSPYADGKAYIFLGKSNPTSVISALNADIKLFTNSFDYYFGGYVSNAGDVNADGFDDILVSGSDISPVDIGSRVYLVYGRSTPPSTISLLNVPTPVFKNCGNPAYAGDFNYDGYDDIILNSSSSVRIFFGGDSIPNENFASNADVSITGPTSVSSYSFGNNNTYVSDVNNDGFGDVVLSDTSNFPGLPLLAGGVYVILGSENPASIINCEATGIMISGLSTYEKFGCSVSGIGDFNNDGINDFIIGASHYDTNIGRAFIFFGKTNFSSKLDETDADIELCGTVVGHFADVLAGGK